MKSKLGELLVQQGLVSSEQLREALSNQLTVGGRLGTNLIELGAINLDQLAQALGLQHGVPVANPAQLDKVPQSTLSQVQPAFCAAKGVIPILIQDRTLHLAMLDPPSVEAIRQMTAGRGVEVQAYAVAQLRLLYYLEKHYSIQRSKRFLRLNDGGGRRDDRRQYLAPTVNKPPETVRFKLPEPEPEADDGLVYLDQVVRETKRGGKSDFDMDIDVTFEGDDRVCAEEGQSIDASLQALTRATSRDAVLQTIVRPLCPETSLNVVFVPRGELGVATTAWGTDVTPPKVAALVVPLNMESLLQRAFETGETTRGTLAEDDLQEMIAVYLRAEPPANVCVAPVSAGGRVVNLICAQTTTTFPPGFATILERLASAATAAYDRLLAELTGG